MSIKNLLAMIEDAGFTIHEYHEDGVLCGYEIETWTDDLGINMVEFLDCRASSYANGITPDNIIQELTDAYTCFDVDEQTVTHYHTYDGLRHAGIARIARDFEAYEKKLETLCIKAAS